jgi:hypothetical protein
MHTSIVRFAKSIPAYLAISRSLEVKLAEQRSLPGVDRDPIRGGSAKTLPLIVFFGRRCDYY